LAIAGLRRCDNEPVEEPLLNVVKGDPTPEELAAVVAAVAAKLSARTAAPKPKASGWAAYWRTVRQPIQPGPGAWRRSGLPR
jgi:Acyl-CoA carboxylase epsilon subunit